MFSEILFILNFIGEAFLKNWPYLLLTIPLAVAVNVSGASRYIKWAFGAKPLLAIVLATVVGAFSPFCSCSVIPVVASLLIGGVPLAPVMAFWIASPSMDPEIFFLSVATLGWPLALWRVAATLALSLTAGFVTHSLMQRRLLGDTILRVGRRPAVSGWREWLKNSRSMLQMRFTSILPQPATAAILAAEGGGTSHRPSPSPGAFAQTEEKTAGCQSTCTPVVANNVTTGQCAIAGGEASSGASCDIRPPSFRRQLLAETWAATAMVIKFMLLAFFLEALIIRYLPSAWIVGLLGQQNPGAIVIAALIGVPLYTTNLTALPLIGGLLAQGMSPGAALAFLVAGPTTTLPAMAAVWGLTTRRVFALYVSFSLLGAVILGYLFQAVGVIATG